MNSILKKTANRRWPLRCLLFFVVACNTKAHPDNSASLLTDSLRQAQKITAALDSIYRYKKVVKDGDLIMRTGVDFTSETMRRLSSYDKTYSHCGIASIEHDSLFVYHSIGGEWNPDQKLRRDPFEIFCNPFESRGFGVFRYKLTPLEIGRLVRVVQRFYDEGILFDMQFDLASNERMYCTEFVYKAIKVAAPLTISLSTTTLNHIEFVAPDNLFINPSCREIKRVLFDR